MTRTVDVCVVTSIGLVFYVGRIDRDTTRLFLRGLVDLRVVCELGRALVCEHFGNCSSKSGLSVVDMACERVKTRREKQRNELPIVPMFM